MLLNIQNCGNDITVSGVESKLLDFLVAVDSVRQFHFAFQFKGGCHRPQGLSFVASDLMLSFVASDLIGYW